MAVDFEKLCLTQVPFFDASSFYYGSANLRGILIGSLDTADLPGSQEQVELPFHER